MASPPRHLGGRDPLPLLSPRQQHAESGETGTTSFGTSGQCSPSHARSPRPHCGERPPTSRDVVPPLRTSPLTRSPRNSSVDASPPGKAGAPSGASPTAPTAPWPTPACTRTSPLAPTPPAHAPPHGSPHGARHAQAVIASQNLSPRFARGGGSAMRVEQQPANLARRGKTWQGAAGLPRPGDGPVDGWLDSRPLVGAGEERHGSSYKSAPPLRPPRPPPPELPTTTSLHAPTSTSPPRLAKPPPPSSLSPPHALRPLAEELAQLLHSRMPPGATRELALREVGAAVERYAAASSAAASPVVPSPAARSPRADRTSPSGRSPSESVVGSPATYQQLLLHREGRRHAEERCRQLEEQLRVSEERKGAAQAELADLARDARRGAAEVTRLQRELAAALDDGDRKEAENQRLRGRLRILDEPATAAVSPDRSPPAGGREAAASDGGGGGTELVQLQLQAALSALGAMEEMWGPEQSVETPAAELLRRESNSLVVARCADLGAEAAALREGLAELKHAHTSARSLCFKRLRSVRALVEKAAAAGEAGARDPWLLEKLRGGADDEEEE